MILIMSVFISAGCNGGGSGNSASADTTAAGSTITALNDLDSKEPLVALTSDLNLPDTIAPTVVAVAPVNGASGVAVNTGKITAAFSEPMDSAMLTTASFTLECPSGNPITGGGAVTYLSAGRVATLPLPAATNLPPSTVCTATMTTAAKDQAGNALASNFVWTFTTGTTPDTTKPRVISTFPATTIPDPTTGVPINTAITVIFSEDMDPATITAASFKLTGPDTTPIAGISIPVAYAVGSRTAIFTPDAELTAGTTYTATITTAAKDLAGNQLAGNQADLPGASSYVWTFTTAAAAAFSLFSIPPVSSTDIYVTSSFPDSGAQNVCSGETFSATLIVPSGLRIDPLTINGRLIGPEGEIPISISLDNATGRLVSFAHPNSFFLPVGTYTVTLYGGVNGIKDLAIPANTMASDYTLTFTVVQTEPCLAPIPVHPLGSFGVLSCAVLSGSKKGPTGTTVNGDIGTTLTQTSITNFVGGGTPATPGIVNGTIYASDLPTAGDVTSATAAYDAYVFGRAVQSLGAAGTVVSTSDLGAVVGFGPAGVHGTFYPGTYHSATSMSIRTPITLDARGDANATWIFEMGSTLTTSERGNIILKNNAKANNVYWMVGSSATLRAPAFSGNLGAAISISVGRVDVTVEGRLIVVAPGCVGVTFDDHLHTVNVPAP